MMTTIQWWPAVVGVLLLFLGRRLYWLFVGGVGFVVGFSIASNLIGRESHATALVVGLVAGLCGVVLALLLQRVAVVVAGLLAGAWLGVQVAGASGAAPAGTPWLPALIGGVLGALLSLALFSAVLVVLSSLVGAALLARLLDGKPLTQGIAFLLLTLLGIAVQARGPRRSGPG